MSTAEACCNVPPIEVDYTPKGSYITVQGMKTYKTGPSDASSAILVIGDIFGAGLQVLQGADILAYGAHSSKQHAVYVPDFLRGQYAHREWFSSSSSENQKAKAEYFQGPASPVKALEIIPGTLKDIETESGGVIKKWAVLGLCWGGKVATIAAGTSPLFAAVVSAHPSMVDPKDASPIAIPFALLASKDEDADACNGFIAGLKGEKHFETFHEMPHGWMAARGNLNDPAVKEQYRRAYAATLEFFHKYL
ncbi:dienelactone hydrolase [Usnea florida]